VHRFYVPGCRIVGGRFVTLTAPPAAYADGGTLAAPTVIRGVPIPAGSELFVDCDFDHIHVHLHEPIHVRGVPLLAGDRLEFLGRVLGFPGLRLPWWTLPIVLVALPFLVLQRRRAARDIRVLRDGKYSFVIAK
jgi:hypothetical protein